MVKPNSFVRLRLAPITIAAFVALAPLVARAQRATHPQTAQPRQAEDPRYSQTEKPPLHATHWLAITGKPLSATAGALILPKAATPSMPRLQCSRLVAQCGTRFRAAVKLRR